MKPEPSHNPSPSPLSNPSLLKWLDSILAAQKPGGEADVPCGKCVGCCTSAYFIHIEPDEKAALAAIPRPLLFKAPGLPKGHMLMGYQENGHCPMFQNGKCSIYSARPRTCRKYDCRIFAATGIEPDSDKPHIVSQVQQWQFAEPIESERILTEKTLQALHSAAQFLNQYGSQFSNGIQPKNPTQQAEWALKAYRLFWDADLWPNPLPPFKVTDLVGQFTDMIKSAKV